jgi:hypothetical protein
VRQHAGDILREQERSNSEKRYSQDCARESRPRSAVVRARLVLLAAAWPFRYRFKKESHRRETAAPNKRRQLGGRGGADSSTINFLRPTAFPGHTGFLSAATDYLCKRYCQDRAALRVVPARRERAVVRAGLSPLAWPFLLSDWVQKKWGATAEESASHRQPVPTKALDANSFIAVWLAPATAPISFRFVGYRNRCESNHCG